ncbi:MAG: cell division protein FtsH [Pirellulaceae bacterium]
MNVPQPPSDQPSDVPSDMPGDELVATAFHEAGHAVMAFSLGRPIEKVTIVPGKMQFGGTRLGACKIQKGRTKSTKDWLEDEALILLAGMVAEAHFTGRYCPNGASQDLRAVERLVESRLGANFANQRQFDKLLKRWIGKTQYVLDDPDYRQAIEWIADDLIKKSTVSGRAVRHFFQQATKTK